MFFRKKNSSFSKFQFFKFSINWTWFSTDWKSWIFRPKLTAPFDSCSILAQSIKICLTVLSIVARFLSTDWNSNFFNFLRVFSFSYQVRLFYPFFSFKLHTFMHKFITFFKNFELKEFGVFDDFWCFWFGMVNGFLCMHLVYMISMLQFKKFHDLWKFSKLGFMFSWGNWRLHSIR